MGFWEEEKNRLVYLNQLINVAYSWLADFLEKTPQW